MDRKIKVLVDGHVFDGMYQGSRTFLKGLYSELSESDELDIYIAAHDLDGLESEFSGIHGKLNYIKLSGRSRHHRLLWDLPKIIKKYRFDYAHYQYIEPPVKLCRTIITVHDVLFLEFKKDFSFLYRQRQYLFKLAASRANILTTSSEYSRKAINNHLGIDKERIHIVRPALENIFRIDSTKTDTQKSKSMVRSIWSFDKYILYVSRIEPRKNHDILLQAFLELELWASGYHLVFVGKTSIINPRLQVLLASLDGTVSKYVHHVENVPDVVFLDVLRAADLFVYPTKAEGFGFPPLEAAALGVETLVSDATCLSEFGFFGDRFFSPHDLAGLKDKISAVLSGSLKIPSMKDISRMVRDEFSWEKTAMSMERLILNDHRGG